MQTAGEGVHRIFKKPGRRKKMHSVLEGLSTQPICISSPNLAKWLKISNRTF